MRGFRMLGIKVDASEPHTLKIDSREITSCEAPYELVRSMRASFLVMGPLLARKGYAVFPSRGAALSAQGRLICT